MSKEMELIAKDMADAVKTHINKVIKPLQKEISIIKWKLKKLEGKE